MSEEREAIDRLKRIAFGPDATPEERSAAEESLREREHDSQALVAAVAAANDEPNVEFQHPGASEDSLDGSLGVVGDGEAGALDEGEDQQSAEQPLWQRPVRAGWLIPVVVGFLLVGVVGALGATGQLDAVTSADPSTSRPVGSDVFLGPEVGEIISGDLRAADAWFEIPFTEADTFPYPEVLEAYGISGQEVRATSISGAWIGRTETEMCLLLAGFDTNPVADCVDRDQFEKVGVRLRSDDVMFRWFGGLMTVDVNMYNSSTQFGTSMPMMPSKGPGSVDAVNALFDEPATEDDVFIMTSMLDQLGADKNQMRFIGADEAGHKLWVIRQGTVGFCLATYDMHAEEGLGACASIQDFEESGISISTRSFAAWWDGTNLAWASPQ